MVDVGLTAALTLLGLTAANVGLTGVVGGL